VKTAKDLLPLKKLLQKKPLTIILVYATWCPHCHTMMPHFDEAAKSPKNTVSAVKINETMLDSVNNFVKKNVNRNAEPIKVEGYPSVILVNKNAEKVADLEAVRNTDAMKKVMEESGNLAINAGLDESLHLNKNKVNRNKPASQVVEDVAVKNLMNVSTNTGLAQNVNTLPSLSIKNMNKAGNNSASLSKKKESMKNAMAPSPLNTFHSSASAPNLQPTKEMKEEAEQLESISGPVYPVSPPSSNSSNDVESFIISNKLSPSQKVGGVRGGVRGGGRGGGRGGSLFDAMARATYTLAPTAALLATAAMVVRKNHGRRVTKKGARKGKKSTSRRL
jgi:thiol-disulfide isomerase/thioredoxin